jgi:methylenetetrahydrofolate dehydrogenase (NADP+)/methenyltetrahydrofolate cyclohydrolase
MNIIDGRLISSKLKEEYKKKIANLSKKPFLVMIRIGDDAASEIYVRNKGNLCSEL